MKGRERYRSGTHTQVWLDAMREGLPPRILGNFYELKFEQALTDLQERNLIISWRKTDPYEDHRGIDYLIQATEKLQVPYQVTSSYDQARVKRKKQKEFRVAHAIPVTNIRQRIDPKLLKSLDVLTSEILTNIDKFREEIELS